VSGWALPAAAGAFWAGVLAGGVRPAWLPPWAVLAIGLIGLVFYTLAWATLRRMQVKA